ncbi:MAG: hypothetical protein NUV82_02870 [Candidatus Komeilibacteria bacterium]|nr:hypothetical protein [Candidatus Komeilibacteria bacterium]
MVVSGHYNSNYESTIHGLVGQVKLAGRRKNKQERFVCAKVEKCDIKNFISYMKDEGDEDTLVILQQKNFSLESATVRQLFLQHLHRTLETSYPKIKERKVFLEYSDGLVELKNHREIKALLRTKLKKAPALKLRIGV